ncbi:MAG: VCBS repeat-containing protein [Bacteroidota bacterium]
MKSLFDAIKARRFQIVIVSAALLSILGSSCSNDEITPDPPDNNGISGNKKFMFCYRKNDVSWGYSSLSLTDKMGSEMASGHSDANMDGWSVLAGIEVGSAQFVFGHNKGGTSYNKDWAIRKILSNGDWGEVTGSGDWENNYETVLGFRVGAKGFLFGLDSYGDHHWFVQEVTAQGTLATRESDSGEWHNFYESATPIYVNGNTYLFFQTFTSDHYWFISHVSQDGRLTDVCDGYWSCFWEGLTSVEVGGNAYLIGDRYKGTMSDNGEWFIQQINSDGTMGPETDRGIWHYYYHNLRGYSFDGRAYIFGHMDGTTDAGWWFTQEIKEDGTMGSETSSGYMNSEYVFFYPFNIYEPGSFRYTIGWDMSKTTGAPSRSWSGIYKDSWSGEMKFGGGAALANIDGDSGGRLDAVLMGIKDQSGDDRFYYRVAWNLDGTGKTTAWSEAIYGPSCAQSQAGGGADIGFIDSNSLPDLLLMSVDDPQGSNSFRYNIGWNMGSDGQAASWSGMIQGPSIGDSNSGGGAALGDIDKNGRPDVVFMGIDNPEQKNYYWYMIGKNLDQSGKATSWTQIIHAPCDLGWSSAGGGAALADVNGNGKPDLVLMNIDSPEGANAFWCNVGWDIDINGTVSGWSSFTGPKPGYITEGGGAAVADIDKNGILDLLLMTVDNPYGKD